MAFFLALVTFWIDYRDRVEERTVRAWQLLTTKAPGNSGKREALEYLNREDGLLCNGSTCLVQLKGRTPLIGIDLSVAEGEPGVLLIGANLADAYLNGANFAGAYLGNADLDGAYLAKADLAGARLCRTVMPDESRCNRNCDPAGACPWLEPAE